MPRKCVFGCRTDYPVFSLPKVDAVREQWLEFIFENHPRSKTMCHVCARHFTEGCFMNKSLYDSGLINNLSLKANSVPTIKFKTEHAEPEDPPKSTISTMPGRPYTSTTRTVATQLSAGTLKLKHYRSKGVQATLLQLSSTPLEPGLETEPPKKRRVQSSEEEEDDLSISDLTEMKSSEFRDAKYIVFESALRELFEDCPVCNRHCIVNQRTCGTWVAFEQDCPHCSFTRIWQSQPMRGNTPQGNLELSAAVHFNGGPYTKIEKICNTMKLKVHNSAAFKRHTENFS